MRPRNPLASGECRMRHSSGNPQSAIRDPQWFVVAALLLTLLTACAGARTAPRADMERLGEIYQRAETYYRNHFYDKALNLFVEVYRQDPKGEFADNALYKIAGIHMRMNEPAKAIVYFQNLQADFPDSPYAQEAIYNLGYCHYLMDEPDRAFEAYRAYLAIGNARNKARARVLAAQSLTKLGRFEEALGYYATAAADERERDALIEMLKDVKVLIDENIPGERMAVVAPELPDGVVRDYARFRAGQDLASTGKTDEAKAMLSAIDYGRGTFRFYQEARRSLDALAGGPKPDLRVVAPVRGDGEAKAQSSRLYIGVVLPLSGRFSVYGDQALHGIMLAVEQFGGTKGAPPIEVVIRDSEGEPELAAAKMRELADDERVVAVIGALMVKESGAAAGAAEELELPLVALTRDEALLKDRHWTFRNAVTFEHQAEALIKHAEVYEGATTFGIVHPDNEYGRAFAEAFERELASKDLDAVVVTGYAESVTDFRAQARRILGAKPDAVFIPDYADRVALMAPQLVYFGVKDVTLLGPSSWNDDKLAEKAGAYLRKAVVVDGFFARAAESRVADFVAAYNDKYAEAPTLLSALGYDSVGMLARIAAAGNADSRAAIRRGLTLVRAYPGVSGETTLDLSGECRKTLFMLRVGDSEIEEMY